MVNNIKTKIFFVAGTIWRFLTSTQNVGIEANDIINIIATYKKAEDLINIGAYVEGSNPEIDNAIKMTGRINSFLSQDIEEKIGFEETKEQLLALFDWRKVQVSGKNNISNDYG